MDTPRGAVRPVQARTRPGGGIARPGGRTRLTGAREARTGTRPGTHLAVMAAWRASTDGPVAGETSGAVAEPAWRSALSTESEARARVTFAAARQEGICMEESLGRVSRGVPGENVSWPRNHAAQRPSDRRSSVAVSHPSVAVSHPSVAVSHPSVAVSHLPPPAATGHANVHFLEKGMFGRHPANEYATSLLRWGTTQRNDPPAVGAAEGSEQLVRSCHV